MLHVGMAEMVTYLPISSPFIRFAGRFVDEAFGVAAGYNFFIFEAALVPFEVVACNVIIHYWSEAVPAGGIIAIVLVLYALVTPSSTFPFKRFGSPDHISFWTKSHMMPLTAPLTSSLSSGMVNPNSG